MGQLYPNNSAVIISDIGVDDNALHCLTGSSWHFPGQSTAIGSSGDFSTARIPSAIRLNRRNDVMEPEGLYCCKARNASRSICIAILTHTSKLCAK